MSPITRIALFFLPLVALSPAACPGDNLGGPDLAADDAQAGDPCANAVKDDSESDTDCGGTCATGCAAGKNCNSGRDCRDGVCTNNACDPPRCDDARKNGDDGDIDCGGACPTKCPLGKQCSQPSDCASTTCIGMTCVTPLCMNGKQDEPDETDIDCRGRRAVHSCRGRAVSTRHRSASLLDHETALPRHECTARRPILAPPRCALPRSSS